ncbi:MAG: DUF1802 family protein [Candidatus Hodarchaeota archaeon]
MIDKALKDWSTVINALGRGIQTILIRKGGRFVTEEKETFKIAYDNFLLYPTYAPEQKKNIKKQFYDLSDRAFSSRPAEGVKIEFSARCEDVIEVKDFEKLKSLSNHYVWLDDHVKRWFEGIKAKKAYVLVLRVYRLPEPLVFEVSDAMARSMVWVNLPSSVSTEGAVPVLDNEEFGLKGAEIKEVLKLERPPSPEAKVRLGHKVLVKALEDLAAIFDYQVSERRCGRYILDCTWKTRLREKPSHAFEVHIGGDLFKDIASLKHAWDVWGSKPFLVSSSEKLEKARDLISGAFHEIEDKIIYISVEDLMEFYRFKKKYSKLENQLIF